VQVDLVRTRDEVPVDITCNIEGASVKINGTAIGTAPQRYIFAFARNSKEAEWNTFLIVVERDGYRYRASSKTQPGDVQPFSTTLTYDEARTGKLDVKLEPIRFVLSPVIEMKPTSEGMVVSLQNLLSQVGDIEREPKVGGATKITDFELDRAKYESRISVMTNGQRITYAVPFWLPQSPDKTYFNLWLQRVNERTRVTDATQQDLEVNVSPAGQWIYFSSDRLMPGRYNIWRVPAVGRGGLTKITDSPSSVIDTEPAISPDGAKMAYTCFLRGTKLPQIWVANADGTLPTQIRVGKSPSWSPDGTKIAYVAPDTAGHEKIWIMEADGSAPTQLTLGEHTDQYPVWTPNGKRIVFASDQAVNEEGQRNFDIWIMKSDGTGITQLTVNGSHDTRPVITPDGKYVYFNSNRGARRSGEPALQIWRIELPAE
jgi:tricorn protease-like protein